MRSRAPVAAAAVPRPQLNGCGYRATASAVAAPLTARSERRPRAFAFTLIELLVVIGVIVVLLIGGALALSGRGSEGAALANAQKIVDGMISMARAQAALNQTDARLLVYYNIPPAGDWNKYLRTLQVVRQDPTNQNQWIAVGDSVTLPAPICVVPISPVPTNHLSLPTGQSWNNNAVTGPVSTLQVTNMSYLGQAAGRAQFFGLLGGSGRVMYLQFDPTGATVPNPTSPPTKIALATAILKPNAVPTFNNAFGVRGIIVRKTGAISFVNDSTSF
jgi:type II secretory pathway pseudopilin PulG